MIRLTAVRILLYAIAAAAIISIFVFRDRATRYFASGVLIAMPIQHQDAFLFNPLAVDAIRADFPGQIETVRISRAMLFSETASAPAQLLTTGEGFFPMSFIPINSGHTWQNHEAAIILDEHLAFALFGSIDVAGHYIRIGEAYFAISAVAQIGQNPGYAWIPRGAINQPAGILMYKPYHYNPLRSRLEINSILQNLGRHPADFFITDINNFITSIDLRARLTLTLAIAYFITLMLILATRLYREQHLKSRIIAGAIALASIAVFLALLPNMQIDLWRPAFGTDGWRAYAQTIFNTNQLAPLQYLPNNLASLRQWNILANAATATALSALLIDAILRFIDRPL